MVITRGEYKTIAVNNIDIGVKGRVIKPNTVDCNLEAIAFLESYLITVNIFFLHNPSNCQTTSLWDLNRLRFFYRVIGRLFLRRVSFRLDDLRERSDSKSTKMRKALFSADSKAVVTKRGIFGNV